MNKGFVLGDSNKRDRQLIPYSMVKVFSRSIKINWARGWTSCLSCFCYFLLLVSYTMIIICFAKQQSWEFKNKKEKIPGWTDESCGIKTKYDSIVQHIMVILIQMVEGDCYSSLICCHQLLGCCLWILSHDRSMHKLMMLCPYFISSTISSLMHDIVYSLICSGTSNGLSLGSWYVHFHHYICII
jgi:hypothetical protein